MARAFGAFDRLSTGQLAAGDLDAVLQNGIARLPRRAVAELVARALGSGGGGGSLVRWHALL